VYCQAKFWLQYLLSTVETSLVDLLSFGLIDAVSEDTKDPTRSLRMEIAEICLTLLPNAIGLSDVFGLTDWELDRYYLVISVYTSASTQRTVFLKRPWSI